MKGYVSNHWVYNSQQDSYDPAPGRAYDAVLWDTSHITAVNTLQAVFTRGPKQTSLKGNYQSRSYALELFL